MTSIYPWQQSQWKFIISQFIEGRLPHALLLSGQEGMGQYDFAMLLAKKVLCSNAKNEMPCDECRSCHLFQSGSHPDFYEVTLEEKSKNIKIDQVRELVSHLNQTSQLDGYQVAIIHPADAMNRFAANALLKTLEEPNGNVLFILIANEPSRLLATILSRCQNILFSAKEDSSTLQWLSKHLEAQSKAKLLFSMAEYAPLKALQLAELNYLSIRNELLKNLIQLQENKIHPIKIVENYIKQDVGIIFMAFVSLLLDISRLQLGATKIINEDCLSELKNISRSISCLSLQNYLFEVVESRKLFLGAISVNVQLLLENLLLQWVKLKIC